MNCITFHLSDRFTKGDSRPSKRPPRDAAASLGAITVLLFATSSFFACASSGPEERPPVGGSSGAGGATGGMGGAGGMISAGHAGTSTAGGASGSGGAGGLDAGVDRDSGGPAAQHRGSSGKVVCPPGSNYPDPLAGMGVISEVTAPSTPPANYFAFIEGPVWIGSVNTLFFSDNASSPTERIFELAAGSSVPQSFMEASGSNGLAVDNADQLLVADQRNRRVVRVDSVSAQVTGVVVPVGEWVPNDLIMRSDDNLYFTDPITGFYRVSASGVVSNVMKQASRANGIALSLDENKLYIGDQGSQTILAFSLAADGSVDANGVAFAKARGATLDGLAVDCAGNVYAATQTGVEVYSPLGMLLGVVPTGESSNCTFGGPDRKTLYVTSRAVLKAVTLNVPGLPD